MNIRWLFPLLLCLMLVLQPGSASAQQNGITWEITPGFDGSYKDAAWFPVAVTISNAGSDLRATLSVGFRNSAGLTYRQEVDLPRGANKRVVIPVINANNDFGNTRLDVTLRDGSRVIRSETVNMNPIMRGANVVGVISDEDGALAELSTFEERSAVPVSLVRLKSAELPDRLELLQTIDVLFVHAVDTTIWTEAQRSVVQSWIGDGGILVVGNDERVIRGLSDLLPATAGSASTPSNLQGLRSTGWALRDADRQVPLVQLAPKAGAQVVATGETGQPLVVQQSFGAGRIIQAAFALEALRDVGNPTELWTRLLGLDREGGPMWEQLRLQGFSILRESLQLPQLGFLSGLGLFGFLAVYILVIGPINYLVLRRFNRREWAYFTIPLWVLAFSAGAYAWGTLGRGSSVLINQLGIVRVAPEAEQGQGLSYLSLFSPTRTSYSLEFAPNALVTDAMASWRGIASDFDVLLAEGSVQVPELSVDVGGMTLLSVEQPVAAPKLTAILREQNGQAQITLRNQSDQPLTDVVLFRGDGQIQEIGTLAPGVERTIVMNSTHHFQEMVQISGGDVVQRQGVVRQLGNILQPNGFMGGFGEVPAVEVMPAQPAQAYPQPVPAEPVPAIPTPTPADPATGEAIPTVAPAEPGGALPTATPVLAVPDAPAPRPRIIAQPNLQDVWYVLAWQPQAAVEMKLDGNSVQSSGETLYIWTAQKEQ